MGPHSSGDAVGAGRRKDSSKSVTFQVEHTSSIASSRTAILQDNTTKLKTGGRYFPGQKLFMRFSAAALGKT